MYQWYYLEDFEKLDYFVLNLMKHLLNFYHNNYIVICCRQVIISIR
jgi:hypothetical protein